jgi:hypothetical protein
VVVGVHRLGRVIDAVAQDLVGAVGDHFVGIHVVAGARTGLERIDDKLVLPASVDDFLGRLDNGLATFLVKHAQVHVHQRRCLLDDGHAPHKGAIRSQAADAKVVHSAHGLGTIERAGRYLDLAQRVLFDP